MNLWPLAQFFLYKFNVERPTWELAVQRFRILFNEQRMSAIRVISRVSGAFAGRLLHSDNYTQILGAGGEDKVVGVWDARNGELIRKLKVPHAIRAVAVSPDGAQLAIVAGWTAIWDTPNGLIQI